MTDEETAAAGETEETKSSEEEKPATLPELVAQVKDAASVKDAAQAVIDGVLQQIQGALAQGGNNAELQARVQAVVIAASQSDLASAVASHEKPAAKAEAAEVPVEQAA